MNECRCPTRTIWKDGIDIEEKIHCPILTESNERLEKRCAELEFACSTNWLTEVADKKRITALEAEVAEWKAATKSAEDSETEMEESFVKAQKRVIALEARNAELEARATDMFMDKFGTIDSLKQQIARLEAEKAELENLFDGDQAEATVFVNIVRKWSREQIERHALHLLGDEYQEKLARLEASRDSLLEALRGVAEYGGCFCEFHSSQHTDYRMAEHTDFCLKAQAALAKCSLR